MVVDDVASFVSGLVLSVVEAIIVVLCQGCWILATSTVGGYYCMVS
jgi:hypothetical protein